MTINEEIMMDELMGEERGDISAMSMDIFLDKISEKDSFSAQTVKNFSLVIK